MPDTPTIPHAPATGKQHWNRLVVLEHIQCEMRSLVLQATDNPRATLPEFYDWAHDLRRGRTNILGGFFRLTEAMQRKGMGHAGRMLALRLLDLARQYVDAMLPESPAPTPTAAPIPPLRLYKPVRAQHARVVGRKAA